MSKNTVVSIVVFVLAIYGIVATKGCMDNRAAKVSVVYAVDHKDDTIRYYKGRYNTEVAEKDQVYADLQTMEEAYKHDMDSVADRLKLSKGDRKHIQTIDAVGTVTAGTVDMPLGAETRDTVHDTVMVCRPFADSCNRWFKIWGEVCENTLDVHYEIYDSLVLTSGDWERKGWFGRKRVTTAYSYNPSEHVKGLTSLQVKEEKPGRLGIGPFAGLALMPGSMWLAPVMGVSVHWSLIRF